MRAPLWTIRLFSKINDSNFQEIITGSSSVFILKIIAAGLGFFFNVILTRTMGAENAGLYFLSITCVTILSMICRLGLDQAYVKLIAVESAEENWIAIRQIFYFGVKYAFGFSLLLTIILFIQAPWLSSTLFHNSELTMPLRIGALAILPFTLFVLIARALQGLKRMWHFVLVQSVCRPVFSIVTFAILVPFFSVKGAMLSFPASCALTLFIGIFFLKESFPKQENFKKNNLIKFSADKIIKSSTPLFFISILNLVFMWSSSLMIGIWHSTTDVAVFNIALRTSMFISFILVSVSSVTSPKYAELYRKKKINDLGKTARNASLVTMICGSPLAVMFIFFPHIVMNIFGPAFSDSSSVLRILGVGQFVNIATGTVGFLLIMSGKEIWMRNIIACCAFINMTLNILLIPKYGAIGGAVATSVSLIIQNIFAVILVWKKYHIMTIPIHLVFWRQRS